MSCSLLDVACHIQNSAREWWADIGLLNKGLIVLGLIGIIVGISWSLITLLKRVGGWPAVLGAIAVIVGVVLAILPRRPKGVEPFPDEDPPLTRGPFEFGVNKTRPKVAVKRKRPTILDAFPKRKGP